MIDVGLKNRGRYCLVLLHKQVHDKKHAADSLHVDSYSAIHICM